MVNPIMENNSKGTNIETIDADSNDFSIITRADKTELLVQGISNRLNKINSVAKSKPTHVAIDEINEFLKGIDQALSGSQKISDISNIDLSKALLTIENLSLEEEVIRLSERECILQEEIDRLKTVKYKK